MRRLASCIIFIMLMAAAYTARGSHYFKGGKLQYNFNTADSIELVLSIYSTCLAEYHGNLHHLPQKIHIDQGNDTLIEYLPMCNYYHNYTICPDTISRCKSGNVLLTTMIFEYKKMLPLSAFSSCKLTFFWQIDTGGNVIALRSNNISTGHTGIPSYVYAFVDFCTFQKPNSPLFTAYFPDYIEQGKDFTFNYGVTIDEPLDDSIYLELITPMTTNGIPVNYSGNWTKDRPIHFLGYPNYALSSPANAGFHVDHHCGNVRFRPTQINQVSIFTVKVNHFKKRNGITIKVSEVMYEHEVIVLSGIDFRYYFPTPKINDPVQCIQKSLYPPIICGVNAPRLDPEKLICTNDSVRLSTYQDTSYLYQWRKNGNLITGAEQYFYWAIDSGVYTVDVANKQTLCFRTSTETRVTIFDGERPTIEYDSNRRYCIGDTALINRGDKTYSWQLWKKDGEAWSDDTSRLFEVKDPGTYTLHVLNTQGCRVNSNALQIVFYTPDTSSLFLTDEKYYCGSFIDTLLSGIPLLAYHWQPGVTPDSILPITEPGMYYLSGKDTNNCFIDDSVNVVRNLLPEILPGIDTVVCYNATINMQLQATMVYNPHFKYTWNGSLVDTNNVFTVADSGTYTVLVIDSNNCAAGDTFLLKRFQWTPLNLGEDKAVCKDDVLNHNLLATPAYVNHFKYLWNNNPTDTLNSYLVTDTGVYFVQLTDSNNCQGADTIQMKRHPGPTLDLGADTSVCFPEVINRSLKAGDSYITGFKYSWNNSSTDTLNSLMLHSEGLYFVEVTDTSGCSANDSVNIIRHPKVTIDLGNDTVFCQKEIHTLEIPPGYSSYEWSTGANGNFTSVSSDGIYSVVITDTNNCLAGDTVSISFRQSPKVVLNDSILCERDFIVLQVADGYDSYRWSTGSTSSYTEKKDTGAVWVKVTNVCGELTASAWIQGCRYEPPIIFIPNAFSPNGDYLNNRFIVYGENIRYFNIAIFNRWGQVIYKSSDINDGWDGNFQGKPAPQDVYMYVVSIQGLNWRLFSYSGNVTVIR